MRNVFKQFVLSAFALLVIASCSKDEETIAPAKYAIDLSTKDYGNVEVEKTASQTFKISNKGGKDLVLESFTIKGTSEFNTSAVKTTVKAGKEYSFNVNFAPTTKGSKTATVSIATNVGTKTITLKGNATPKPVGAFSINPTSKDFGNVEVSKTANQVFTIKNTGNADLKITGHSITGTNANEFLTGEVPQTFTIAAGTTKDITIIFSPETAGSKTATLKLTTNVGDQTVSLQGKATPQAVAIFGINPSRKDFGNVRVNKTANQVFTIKNTGNANLEIKGYSITGADANQFVVNPAPVAPFTIAPNNTKEMTVVFSPKTAGSKTAKLNLVTNAGKSFNYTINLNGKGITLTEVGVVGTVPQSGLVAFYNFAGNANDVKGSAHGTANSKATLTKDRFGKDNNAYKIANGGAINLGNQNFFSGKDKKFSVSAWVNPNTNSGKVQTIIAAYSGPETCSDVSNKEFYISTYNNIVRVVYYDNGTGYRGVHSSKQVKLNQWTNIVVSYDGSINTKDGRDRIKIYINGVLESSYRYPEKRGSFPFDIKNTNAHVGIGEFVNDSGQVCSAKRYPFLGSLDDIAIYNKVVTQAEVTQIANIK